MNIFILSKKIDPPKAHFLEQAAFHCDKHVIKMIAETVQMMVTALKNHDYPELRAYLRNKPDDWYPCRSLAKSMIKHPCTQWTMQDILHFNYLACLGVALCQEHKKRYPSSNWHKYSGWIKEVYLHLRSVGMGLSSPLPSTFAVAVKDPEKRTTNCPLAKAVNVYRDYYVVDKVRFATWKSPQVVPKWFLKGIKSDRVL